MYYIVYGFLYLISLLPWKIIYLISDVIAFFLYHIVHYRRQLVMTNLSHAFPEKSLQERTRIAKEFYRNFTDNFLEVIKFLSISRKELDKRFTGNYKAINDLYATGQNVELLLGHYFNWEFANLAYAANVSSYSFIVVYMPISNKIFDRIFKIIRQRFGTHLVAANNYREALPFLRTQHVMVLVADQSPSKLPVYWTDFLNRKTHFVVGPEKNARANKAAVFLGSIRKVKRGYYNAENILLTMDPGSLPEGEITRKMVQYMEKCVREQPANYLWSHNRWKWRYSPEKNQAYTI